ncbi:MAG: rhomboid family intramembrane serine protease [Planctomycetaceae bacterium]|nr:rhomboid family intramembrane serine protease [Planctomycetaceae bacterium]
MGIYDREYYREEPTGFSIRKPGTVIGWLIVINLVVFLASALFAKESYEEYGGGFVRIVSHPVNDWLGLNAGDLVKPWLWWRFLTYGFCHASLVHIFGNMIGLFFLGRAVEQRYGQREFLRIYLAMIVVAGVVWAAFELLVGAGPTVPVVGASGAVVGVIVLFALNYPRVTVLFMMVIPMPAWVLGVIVVASDLYGASTQAEQIAYQAHLAGSAFAFLYWRLGWNFARLTDGFASGKLFQRRPRLRVHHPDDEAVDRSDAALDGEVDRILSKLHRQGRDSLTRKERRILETESQRLREKHGRL